MSRGTSHNKIQFGADLKRHLKALRERYARVWSEEWACVWKLELQRRGAQQVRMLCTPPHGRARTTGETFAVWLSAAWVHVVDHPDPEQRRRHERAGTGLDYAEGLRATDQRRVVAYFTKQSLIASTEYQHHVPREGSEPGAGPGRFWSVWTLQPGRPHRPIGARRRHLRWPYRPPLGPRPRSRPVAVGAARRPDHRPHPLSAQPYPRAPHDQRHRGWIAVNDGPSFTSSLQHHLAPGRDKLPALNHGKPSLDPRFQANTAREDLRPIE